MSFENFKKKDGDQLSKLLNTVSEETGKVEKKNYNDERIWKPTVDKAGNGYAVIRFLPTQNDEENGPWVRYWDHGFKGPTGQWFIEKSLTSLGQECPVSEMNSKLWNSGAEADKQTARERKRRLHYVSNILVVSDPSSPQNEGKVFLYQFGKKIYEKIVDLMQPQFPDEKPVNPYSWESGADFQLKIRNVEGYRNYDKSEFKSVSPIYADDEAKQKTVYEQLHNLGEWIDPKNYLTYDEMRTKLANVLGESVSRTIKEYVALDETASPAAHPSANNVDDSDDDTLSYFAKLANEE